MDWSYVTGYFDGEGDVLQVRKSVRKYAPAISWYNTHLGSLKAIQRFIGCGRIRSRNKYFAHHKKSYLLQVSRVEDLKRIIPSMLVHSIIKREALMKVFCEIQKMKPMTSSWGCLALAGEKVIRKLYKDGLTQKEIGIHFGVTGSAVKNFMRRKKIKSRTQSEAMRLAMKNPTKLERLYGVERNRRISETKMLARQRKVT